MYTRAAGFVNVLACAWQAERKMIITLVGVGKLGHAHRKIRASFTRKTTVDALHSLASGLLTVPRSSLNNAPQLEWYTSPAAGVPQGAAELAPDAGSGINQPVSKEDLVQTTCETIHALLHDAVCPDIDQTAAAHKAHAQSELRALMPNNTLYIDWVPEIQTDAQLSTGAAKKQGLYRDKKTGKMRAAKAPREAWHTILANTHASQCPRYVEACTAGCIAPQT